MTNMADITFKQIYIFAFRNLQAARRNNLLMLLSFVAVVVMFTMYMRAAKVATQKRMYNLYANAMKANIVGFSFYF